MATKTTKKQDASVVDMFATATVVETKKATKSDDKVNIIATEKEVQDAIVQRMEGKIKRDAGNAMIDLADDVIRPWAQTENIKLVEKNGDKESFIISTPKGESLTAIPVDSYKKINEEKYNMIKSTYSPELVTVIDNEDTIIIDQAKAKEHSKEIAADIAKLIKLGVIKKIAANPKWSISKGSWKLVASVAKKLKKTTAEIVDVIEPTFQLKFKGEDK